MTSPAKLFQRFLIKKFDDPCVLKNYNVSFKISTRALQDRCQLTHILIYGNLAEMNAQTHLKPPLAKGIVGTALYTFRHQVHDLLKPETELSEEDVPALDAKFVECDGLSGEERDSKCREIAEWIDERSSHSKE